MPKEFVRFPRTYVFIPCESFQYRFDILMVCAIHSLLRAKARIVFEWEHESGGHFAAYEKPDELVGDLRKYLAGPGMRRASDLGALATNLKCFETFSLTSVQFGSCSVARGGNWTPVRPRLDRVSLPLHTTE